MQASGFLNYRLKYCWPKVTYFICQPNELKQEIKKKVGETKSLEVMAQPGPLKSPVHW